MVNRICSTARQARIPTTIVTPFQSICMQDIIWESETECTSMPLPSAPEDTEDGIDDDAGSTSTLTTSSDGTIIVPYHLPIDGTRTCAAQYCCHLPLKTPSYVCEIYLKKLLVLYAEKSGITKHHIERVVMPHHPVLDTDWQLPKDPALIEELAFLGRITWPAQRNTCLLTDVEFVTLPGQSASIFQTCVQPYQADKPIRCAFLH